MWDSLNNREFYSVCSPTERRIVRPGGGQLEDMAARFLPTNLTVGQPDHLRLTTD